MLQLGGRNSKGQVLVLVALGLVALVAIVALAVDGGHLYAERRQMQVAADAGALAGARVLCYEEYETQAETEAAAESQADIYAKKNDAEYTVVSFPDDLTVTVVATETTNTFFARVIGFPTADVTAIASAMCQGPAAGGDLWPLAVKRSVYENDDRVGCGDLFYAFVDSETINAPRCVFTATRLSPTGGNTEWPTCYSSGSGMPIGLPDVDNVSHVSTSERGFIDLFKPDPPYDQICDKNCNADGGAVIAACWVEHGHPGPVDLDDCLKTEPGTKSSVLDAMNLEDVACQIYNLPLFEEPCEIGDELLSCPGDQYVGPSTENAYKVAGFGCIRVLGSFTVDFWCEDKGKWDWDKNHKVAIVQKMCERYPDDYWDLDLAGTNMPGYQDGCITAQTGTGQAPQDTDPRTIQLIQ